MLAGKGFTDFQDKDRLLHSSVASTSHLINEGLQIKDVMEPSEIKTSKCPITGMHFGVV